MKSPARLAVAALLLGISSATAQITLDFNWDGTNTTATWSVTAGSTLSATSTNILNIQGVSDFMNANGFSAGNDTRRDIYNMAAVATTPWDLSGGGGGGEGEGEGDITKVANSRTGTDVFGFYENTFFVAKDYDLESGPGLSGTMTFNNSSLTDLGFSSNTAMSGSFAVAGTTANWSTSAVPEPSAYAAILGIVVLGFSWQRRRRGGTLLTK